MRPRGRRTTHRTLGVLAVAAVAVAACGSDDPDAGGATTSPAEEAPAATDVEATDAPTEATAEPAATDAAGGTTPGDGTEAAGSTPAGTAATGTATEGSTPAGGTGERDVDVPERVVSLSPTHTEIVFAIGAGDLLVAVDDYSNFPEEATSLPNDLSGFEPNVEAIAAYDPDLVLIGGDFTGLGDQLAELGIESWDGPAATSFDDTYAQIEQLGALTGHVGDAAELVSSMRTRIDELASEAPESAAGTTYYHELGPELYTATSSTFIGEVYGLFGLENVADELEADAGQYPQLSAEFLIGADPQLVFLADTVCCDVTAESVGEREGFGTIAAVQDGTVIELDDDVASRWGPRIVDYVEAVSEAVAQLPVTTGS